MDQKHNNGIDALTLIFKNNKNAKIIQWQSHKDLKTINKE